MRTPDSALLTAIFFTTKVEVTAQIIRVHLLTGEIPIHVEHFRWSSSHYTSINLSSIIALLAWEGRSELREESLLFLGFFLYWLQLDLFGGCRHAFLHWCLHHWLLFFLFLFVLCELLDRRQRRLSLRLYSLGLLLTVLGHHAFADVCLGSCWLHSCWLYG